MCLLEDCSYFSPHDVAAMEPEMTDLFFLLRSLIMLNLL